MAGKQNKELQDKIKKIQDSDISEAAKNQRLAELADEHEANNLLLGDADDEEEEEKEGKGPELKGGDLKTEKDYISFAKEVNSLLDNGKAPYNLVPFFKELASHNLQQLESKKIK